MREAGATGWRASSIVPARRCGSRSETENQNQFGTPGKPGGLRVSYAQSLSSEVSPVAIGHPNAKAPLRRPVKTTRILIAVGEASYRLLPERQEGMSSRGQLPCSLWPAFLFDCCGRLAQFLSFAVRTACHNSGPGRSKKPSIQSLLPPRL